MQQSRAVGNGEEMEIDQPQEGRCIVLSEV